MHHASFTILATETITKATHLLSPMSITFFGDDHVIHTQSIAKSPNASNPCYVIIDPKCSIYNCHVSPAEPGSVGTLGAVSSKLPQTRCVFSPLVSAVMPGEPHRSIPCPDFGSLPRGPVWVAHHSHGEWGGTPFIEVTECKHVPLTPYSGHLSPQQGPIAPSPFNSPHHQYFSQWVCALVVHTLPTS